MLYRKLQLAKMGDIRFKEMGLEDVLKGVQSRYVNARGQRVMINYTPKDGCRAKVSELLIDVFSNLAGNCIKHSKSPVEINILLTKINENNNDYYKVAVEDNSPGISDDI